MAKNYGSTKAFKLNKDIQDLAKTLNDTVLDNGLPKHQAMVDKFLRENNVDKLQTQHLTDLGKEADRAEELTKEAERAKEIIKGIQTPLEKYKTDVEEINKLYADQKLAVGDAEKAVTKLGDEYAKKIAEAHRIDQKFFSGTIEGDATRRFKQEQYFDSLNAQRNVRRLALDTNRPQNDDALKNRANAIAETDARKDESRERENNILFGRIAIGVEKLTGMPPVVLAPANLAE